MSISVLEMTRRQHGRAGDVHIDIVSSRRSDHNVDVETDQWDSSLATPRKYVLAVGIVGSGRGLIRVRTVNGDVVLKRVNP